MPANPTPSDVQVNSLLTDMSVAYVQDQKNFIAREAAPIRKVKLQSGLFAKYLKGDFNRNQVKKRAPRTPAAMGGYRTDNTGNYFCDVWSLRTAIDKQMRSNSQDPFKPDRDAMVFLTQQMMINWEQLFADAVMATGIWSGQNDQTGVASGATTDQFLRWDAAGSTPIVDLKAGIQATRTKTGKRPNALCLGEAVWSKLQDHPDLVDRIKFTSSDAAARDLLARLLEIDRVLVSGAVKNTSAEGVADASVSMADIVGKSATLLYVEKNPGELNPSAVETFAWDEYAGVGEGGAQFTSWWDQDIKADIVEAEAPLVVKVVAADFGCHFTTAIT